MKAKLAYIILVELISIFDDITPEEAGRLANDRWFNNDGKKKGQQVAVLKNLIFMLEKDRFDRESIKEIVDDLITEVHVAVAEIVERFVEETFPNADLFEEDAA